MVACMILVRLRKVRMLDGFVKIINKNYLRYQQTKIKTIFAPQDLLFAVSKKVLKMLPPPKPSYFPTVTTIHIIIFPKQKVERLLGVHCTFVIFCYNIDKLTAERRLLLTQYDIKISSEHLVS
jgi:hypothetical protein